MPSGTPILIVAGGSRGIGAAAARLAGARGFDVAVNYLRDDAAADAVVAAIRQSGRRALAVKGDMGKEDDIGRMFATVERELGAPTHLIYSCGITGPSSRVEMVATDTLRQVLDVNVIGPLIAVRTLVKHASTRHGGPGGAIVLLSSAAATIGGAGEYVWYAASKGAIDSMTLGLARELAGEGIRVNAVAPGLIATEIHPPGRLERLVPSTPIGRAGTAEEVAEAILFLLSDAASYITGSVLRVGGGR
ncbi:MAG TPA: SDR family oxidoreductase [Xanthobacteraceae bacterium]|nr:SDR family oxidoreductase [Xanthobacteraceae bacterium]